MPAAQYEYDTFVAANQATANSAETIIATTRAVSSSYGGCSFAIQFGGLFTAGATTTSVTFKIRQDSITGAALRTDTNVLITAGQIVLVNFNTIDSTRGDSTGAVWVLTAAQNAGTAPGGLTNGFTSVTVPV